MFSVLHVFPILGEGWGYNEWLYCRVLVHVYCPSPWVQYPDRGMGFVVGELVGGY